MLILSIILLHGSFYSRIKTSEPIPRSTKTVSGFGSFLRQMAAMRTEYAMNGSCCPKWPSTIGYVAMDARRRREWLRGFLAEKGNFWI